MNIIGDEINDKKRISQISKIMGRTPYSIEMRIDKLEKAKK